AGGVSGCSECTAEPTSVMPGLVPGIHVFKTAPEMKTWMAVSRLKRRRSRSESRDPRLSGSREFGPGSRVSLRSPGTRKAFDAVRIGAFTRAFRRAMSGHDGRKDVAMHDIKWIRENPEAFDRALMRRAPEFKGTAQRLMGLDEHRRTAIQK